MADIITEFSENYICINSFIIECHAVLFINFQVMPAVENIFNVFLLFSDVRTEGINKSHTPLCVFMLKCDKEKIIEILSKIISSLDDSNWPHIVAPMMDTYNLLLYGSIFDRIIHTCPVNMINENVLIGPMQSESAIFKYFSPIHCDLMVHHALTADFAFSPMDENVDTIEYEVEDDKFRVLLDCSFYIGGGSYYTIPE